MFCMALTNTVCNEMSDMCFFVGQLENKITIVLKAFYLKNRILRLPLSHRIKIHT